MNQYDYLIKSEEFTRKLQAIATRHHVGFWEVLSALWIALAEKPDFIPDNPMAWALSVANRVAVNVYRENATMGAVREIEDITEPLDQCLQTVNVVEWKIRIRLYFFYGYYSTHMEYFVKQVLGQHSCNREMVSEAVEHYILNTSDQMIRAVVLYGNFTQAKKCIPTLSRKKYNALIEQMALRKKRFMERFAPDDGITRTGKSDPVADNDED